MSRIFEALSRAGKGANALPACSGDDAWVDREVPDIGLIEDKCLTIRERPSSRLVTLDGCDSLGAEKFRVLATRLQHMQRDCNITTLVVTSPGPEDGKSVVSANMSIALAALPKQRVLIVEGDFRKPALMRLFGLPSHPGLIQHLELGETVANFVYRLSSLQLWILPAGARPERPLEAVQSPQLDRAIDELARFFTWIVIDAPPLMPMADTNVWARRADGVLLVVREGKSSKEELKQGLAALDNSKVVAAVLNESRSNGRRYSSYYGYK